MPHIGFADVFHPAGAIPIPVDGNERSSTITTGKQSRIPMTGSVAFCPLAALFLEQRLCLLPIFSGNDGRVYILVTEPLFFGNFSEPLAIPHFVLVVIEDANIAFVLKDVLDTGIRPEKLTDIRFLLAVEFHLELRRCFARLLIQDPGDGHERHSVKESLLPDLLRCRRQNAQPVGLANHIVDLAVLLQVGGVLMKFHPGLVADAVHHQMIVQVIIQI